MRSALVMTALLLVLSATSAQPAAPAAIVVDGNAQESAWSGATEITDFVLTQPFNLTPPRLKTTARLLSTPEGLAITVFCEQPDVANRNAAARPRDAATTNDAVSAIIDFDGSGSRAYEFTVGAGGSQRDGIWSGESSFSSDWDGVWQSAVLNDEKGWTVEWLIPWSSVPMTRSRGATRNIRLSFERVVWNLGEFYSYPAINAQQSRYLSRFAELNIASFTQKSLSFVPYLSTRFDAVDSSTSVRSGIDVAWRPSSELALTATIRPDFGQVESDQLVVNFDAIEVVFSDKRPFFTENQAFFDVRDSNFNQLIYTRRVGAQNDLDGAVKLTGAARGIEYGAFAAAESDLGGKDFFAARALVPGQVFSAGYVLTKVSDPLGLDAIAQGADLKVRSGAHSVDALLIATDRETTRSQRDFGGTASWGHNSKSWDFSAQLTHYGRALNFNDFGYLARANLNALDAAVSWRPSQARADGAAVSYNARLEASSNDQGNRLSDTVFLYRQYNGADGTFMSTQLFWNRPGFDDLISRGNGLMRRPGRLRVSQFYQGPQLGDWRFGGSVQNLEEGLGGRAWNLVGAAYWQANDALALDLVLRWRTSKDWLVWRGTDGVPGTRIPDLFARYRRDQWITAINANWIPSPKHELRLKLESLTINAKDARAVRLGAGGVPYATNDVIAPLQVRNLGLQLRYRYEIAPLRELYVVYGRGGFEQERNDERSAIELIQDSFELRDTEQFLVKLRWGI